MKSLKPQNLDRHCLVVYLYLAFTPDRLSKRSYLIMASWNELITYQNHLCYLLFEICFVDLSGIFFCEESI